MHDSRAVANEILKVAKAQGRTLTLMQLIKLVYLAHGWRLGFDNKPMTSDHAEAWQYGPVHRNVYRAFVRFGSKPIDGLAHHDFLEMPIEDVFDEREKRILEQVVKSYGELHASRLSDMTHRAGTPWHETYNNDGVYSEIPDERIRSYFVKLMNNEVDRASA